MHKYVNGIIEKSYLFQIYQFPRVNSGFLCIQPDKYVHTFLVSA